MNILSIVKHIINSGDIDSLNSTIAELESNLSKIIDDNEKKNDEIIRLENKIQIINEYFKKRVSIAENKQREFAIKLSVSEDKAASLVHQNNSLLETQRSLTKDNATLKAKVTRRNNKILSLQELKDQLTGTLIKLQEESSQLVQKNEDLKKKLKESDVLCEKLKEEEATLRETNSNLVLKSHFMNPN